MSPRAAARLESLGFENVCDYVAGKQDWLANGLPFEGELDGVPTLGRLVHREVPVCHFDEKLSDVAERLKSGSWRECVVVSEANVVLGLLRRAMWEGIGEDSDMVAEQTMELAPSTFRPHVRADAMLSHMQEKKMKSALVTTADGKLVGIVRRQELGKG